MGIYACCFEQRDESESYNGTMESCEEVDRGDESDFSSQDSENANGAEAVASYDENSGKWCIHNFDLVKLIMSTSLIRY